MKSNLFLLCLLASASVLCVRGKPHSKHHDIPKHTQPAQEKDSYPEEPNEGKSSILPTFLPFEASSQEQEQEEGDREVVGFGEENKDSSTPVLLSEEALADLLQGSDEEEEEQEEAVQDDQATQEQKGAAEESDVVEANSEEEVKKNEEKDQEGEEDQKEADGQEGVEKKTEEEEEDSDSSTESEIPVDLDYASDSDGSEPRETTLEEAKDVSSGSQPEKEREEKVEEPEQDGEQEEIPTIMSDYDPETGEVTEFSQKKEQDEDKAKDREVSSHKVKNSNNKDGDSESSVLLQEAKNNLELRAARTMGDDDNKQEKQTNESGSNTKGKGRKQKKNQRKRKGQMQGDQPFPGQPTNSGHRQTSEQQKTPESTDNTVQKTKRRRSGKWAPMIGMNPVQIRATVELYPSLRPHPSLPGQGAETNPCENIRCKRGKVCKVNEDNKPVCVCQEASDCPTSVTEFDHVCGTDNKTYDTSCQLFSTKCNLEGTKKGHKLHLDYTGACKFIPPCLSTELAQFPLRMRDWLKNVLLQLYEHDTMAPGFLTPKQRARVQKIYESERRLHAGDHPIELLAQDFEKNYQMYIYPVHWQFAQMDQHPTDRFLSHSELAPLRVPLVPMEHCTSDFFQQCDADKDKQVSFKEWGHCFGIKDEDMDTHLLF